jgi:sodium/potassium-transporting ATPase subunit alpha
MKVPPRKPVTPETIDIFRRRALRRKGSRYDEESGEIVSPESMTKMQQLAHNLRQLFTREYWVDKFENTGAEVLVDGPLLSYAYLEIGIIEAIAALTAFFVVMDRRGISPRDARIMQKGASAPTYYFTPNAKKYKGLDAATQVDILAEAQGMVYFSIMTMQMFNIFACKSRLKLPFGRYMFANRATFYSIIGGASLACFIIYTPGVETVFKTSRTLSPLYWLIPMAFGIVLIGYACLRIMIRMNIRPINWNPDIHGLQMYPTIRTMRTMSVQTG